MTTDHHLSPGPSDSHSAEQLTLSRQWFVACTSRELRQQPIARTVLNRPLVLFRNGRSAVALIDRCAHRNAPLSAGRVIDGCVQCPYHGWQFNSAGQCVLRPGIRQTAPRETAIESLRVCEQSGYVWVCFDPAASASPVSRRWPAEASFGQFTWIDTVEASFADAMENLLDGTHTPFVHSGLVRSSAHQQTFSAIVRIREGFAEAEYLNEGRQAGWISKLFERDRSRSFGRFIPPCLAELEYTSQRGTEFVLNSHFTPESPGVLRVYSTIFLRRTLVPDFVKRWVITPFFRRVLKQDRHILKLQQDNIRRHGGPQFQSWEGDILRGWIDTWLRHGHLPQTVPEHRVDFQL